MQMILFLAVVIGLGVGGWQVCENTDVCYPPDKSKVALETVVAEVAGAETKASENAQNSDGDKGVEEGENEKVDNKNDKDGKSVKSDKDVDGNKDGKKDSKKDVDGSSSKTAKSDVKKSAVCQSYLTAQIRSGGNNDKAQVIKLEKFLNEFEGEKLVAGGRYDAADVAAVKRFQKKYAKEVLAPFGLKNPTGEVMKSTLAQINKLYCEKKKNN